MGSKLERSRESGTTTREQGTKGVIPTSHVVILKESELDCDLATAIQRIRARRETSHSRILVVAPESDEPVAQSEDRERPVVPVPPTTVGQIARRGELTALRALGENLESLVECLERFFGETRGVLEDLAETVPDAARATLAERVRLLGEILDWSGAVAADLRTEARHAKTGLRDVDTHELLVEMAAQAEIHFPGLQVTVGAPEGPCTVRGRAAELGEAFFLALALTACRIGGRGSITVEISSCEGVVAHRIRGHGDPRDVRAGDATARVRELLVRRHGARIVPDRLGPAGAGMTVLLPARPDR